MPVMSAGARTTGAGGGRTGGRGGDGIGGSEGATGRAAYRLRHSYSRAWESVPPASCPE